jgi:hypothetical protein
MHIKIDDFMTNNIIPVFMTNTVEMWPIWCRVVCTVDGVTFVVSISAAKGKLKPKSIEEFVGSGSGRDDTAKREGLQRTDSGTETRLGR